MIAKHPCTYWKKWSKTLDTKYPLRDRLSLWGRECYVIHFLKGGRDHKKECAGAKLNPMLAQIVKNLPAMQETQVPFLGQEDPLEKGMATHSSILYWRIPWTEETGRLQSMGLQRVRHS